MAEAVKVERLAEAVKAERMAEAMAVVIAQAVAVVVKILNCLTCLILRSAMAMESLIGAVLNPMVILEVLGHLPLLVQGARALKILH